MAVFKESLDTSLRISTRWNQAKDNRLSVTTLDCITVIETLPKGPCESKFECFCITKTVDSTLMHDKMLCGTPMTVSKQQPHVLRAMVQWGTYKLVHVDGFSMQLIYVSWSCKRMPDAPPKHPSRANATVINRGHLPGKRFPMRCMSCNLLALRVQTCQASSV